MQNLPFLTPLSAADLAAQGIPPQWRYGLADRVRFSEIDGLGHVNNLAYLAWFESIRVHYLRDYGITSLAPDEPSAVVKGLDAAYHTPMFLNEDYIVTARTLSFRTTSFTMAYGVWAPDCKMEGTALVVQVAQHSTRKVPLSDAVRQRFIDTDGAQAL